MPGCGRAGRRGRPDSVDAGPACLSSRSRSCRRRAHATVHRLGRDQLRGRRAPRCSCCRGTRRRPGPRCRAQVCRSRPGRGCAAGVGQGSRERTGSCALGWRCRVIGSLGDQRHNWPVTHSTAFRRSGLSYSSASSESRPEATIRERQRGPTKPVDFETLHQHNRLIALLPRSVPPCSEDHRGV
jgi:hypothetical protein